MISLSAVGPMAASIAPRAAGAAGATQGFDWRLLLSALSSALPTIAASRANRDAQDDLLQGTNELAQTQRRADSMIGDEISSLATSKPDEQRTLAEYAASVQRSREGAESNAAAPTLGGSQARADTKTAAQGSAQHARSQATFAAGVDAPIRQREREGISANRTAGDVRGLAHEAGTSAFLARLRANRRTPNRWASLLSQLGGTIANNYEPGAR